MVRQNKWLDAFLDFFVVAQFVRGLGEEPEGLQVQIKGKERGSGQGTSPVIKMRSMDGKGAFMKYNVCFIYLYMFWGFKYQMGWAEWVKSTSVSHWN